MDYPEGSKNPPPRAVTPLDVKHVDLQIGRGNALWNGLVLLACILSIATLICVIAALCIPDWIRFQGLPGHANPIRDTEPPSTTVGAIETLAPDAIKTTTTVTTTTGTTSSTSLAGSTVSGSSTTGGSTSSSAGSTSTSALSSSSESSSSSTASTTGDSSGTTIPATGGDPTTKIITTPTHVPALTTESNSNKLMEWIISSTDKSVWTKRGLIHCPTGINRGCRDTTMSEKFIFLSMGVVILTALVSLISLTKKFEFCGDMGNKKYPNIVLPIAGAVILGVGLLINYLDAQNKAKRVYRAHLHNLGMESYFQDSVEVPFQMGIAYFLAVGTLFLLICSVIVDVLMGYIDNEGVKGHKWVY